jgi:hypothetical protein
VGTSSQHGGIGFLFWNAANDYSKPFAAMPVIMKNPAQYLHTSTPATVAQINTATPASAVDQAKTPQSATTGGRR